MTALTGRLNSFHRLLKNCTCYPHPYSSQFLGILLSQVQNHCPKRKCAALIRSAWENSESRRANNQGTCVTRGRQGCLEKTTWPARTEGPLFQKPGEAADGPTQSTLTLVNLFSNSNHGNKHYFRWKHSLYFTNIFLTTFTEIKIKEHQNSFIYPVGKQMKNKNRWFS